jgi:hypothetical protein
MRTFRNTNFTRRDYEATNIVACVAETAPETPDNRWQPADDAVLVGLTQLWIERGVRYYGYL